MSLHDFINNPKTFIVAPAGYGKTYTLATCIGLSPDSERQLILTHTHAGIASIKDKIKSLKIPMSKFQVETITGFIQKYVFAFYCGNDLPSQDAPGYYNELVKKSLVLFKKSSVKRVVAISFNGLFVDEYQDCTISQHNIIRELSKILPTHILADPLQGIFGFDERLVNFNTELMDFVKVETLSTPWRWKRQNRLDLGKDLSIIRSKLIKGDVIELKSYPSIETVICKENELFHFGCNYRTRIEQLLSEDSLLLIHPNTTSIQPRLTLVKLFNNRIRLLESIDDKMFYEFAKLVDSLVFNELLIIQIKDICYKLFSKTGLDYWFNLYGFKRKTKDSDRKMVSKIQDLVEDFAVTKSYVLLSEILKNILKLNRVKCFRKDIFSASCKALEIAFTESISVYEAMILQRNQIRRIGRKVLGRTIGTTLLTKGLEFDTVAILNAHLIKDPRHFYVALTRASKRLIVFSQNSTFQFLKYDQNN